jgi:hypothetical protein
MIEFALVVPILLVILFAILDFGKAFNYWIDETQVASAGARWAVVNKYPVDSACTYPADLLCLQKFIRQQADTSELRNGGTANIKNPMQVCISFPEGGTPAVGDPVTVEVRARYNWLPLFTSPDFWRLVTRRSDAKPLPTSIPLEQSATMRLEALPTNYGAGCTS